MTDAKALPAPQVPWEVFRAQAYQEAVGEAAATRMDETEAGGRYLTPDGTWVDANGRAVKGPDKGAAVFAARGTAAGMGETPPAPPSEDGGYDEMTVAELKDLGATRGIDVPSAAKKADIVALLERADAGAGD